jgi:hypothetical protein
MRAKRYTVEQIVAKLRHAERLQGEGLTIPQTRRGWGSPVRPSTVGG